LAEIQTAGVPPIAYENAEYTPVEGTLYLRESFLPNIKDAVGVAHTSADDYEGLYQVSVMDGRGDRRFAAQEQARLISLHFPRGAEYTYNGVTVKITGTDYHLLSPKTAGIRSRLQSVGGRSFELGI
jgi:hypothetical protein